MSADPLTYLLDRFATDAVTLRARAAHLAGASAPAHGPDAAASLRMAEACELVIAMLNDLSTETDDEMLDALDGLGPELHALSERAEDAFVRSVYGGAATRVSEIVRRSRGDEADGDDDDDVDDDDLHDDVVDDDVKLG
jgi:hypothetical protein